ncbi:uncharacterized protein LOC119140079 [Falco rusticolus]|uniref:uncharacterized protein LOC119140079 n=1 Tax=Falco rusticolus TaxID=120794 RepID=UPI0018866400|nr:uncharacterized protein LOC119140079 [Falco rusticolus]
MTLYEEQKGLKIPREEVARVEDGWAPRLPVQRRLEPLVCRAQPRQVNGVLGGSVVLSPALPPNKTVKEIEWSFSAGATIQVAELGPGGFERPDPRDRFKDRLEMFNQTALRIVALERGDSGVYGARIKLHPALVEDQFFNLSVCGDRASSFSWCNTGGVMDPVSPKVLSLMPSGQTSPGEVLPVSPSLGDHRGCPAQRCFTSLGVSQPVKPLVTGSQAGGFGRRQPLPCRRAGVIPGKHLPWSPVSIWMTFVPSSHLVLLFLGSQRDGRFSPLAGNFNSVIFISPLPSRRGRN